MNMKLGPELVVKLEKLHVYRCEKCPEVFPNISDLMKHKSFHEEYFLSHLVSAYVLVERAKIFKCDKCTQSFDNNREFILHKIAHIQETVRNERKTNNLQNPDIVKPFKCPDCNVSYAAQSTLDAHSILHLPFPHTCDCGIGYYREEDLKGHIKLVHGTIMKEEDILPPKEEKVIPQEKPQVLPPSKPKSKKESKKGPKLKEAVKKEKPKQKKFKVTLKSEDNTSNRPKLESDIPDPDVHFKKTPDNKFECPKCTKLFTYKRNVTIHYRIHSGERPFTCHLCMKTFNQATTLKNHIARHAATEKIYVCRHCPKAFASSYYRERHEHIHSAIKPHECPYCGKAFHDPSALIRHKRIHTGEKRYHCPYCPKAFSDISGLIGHKLRHENRKRFQCEMCFKRFYTQTDVKKHMRVHTHEKRVACDYCKKLFSSKSSLIIHIQGMHMFVKKQFKCEQCNEKFTRKDYLNRHTKAKHNKNKTRRIHLRECKVCFKHFSNHESLREHKMKIHSVMRCDECSRYFESPAHFKYHKLIESVQCEICDVKFNCENMREKHLKVHFPKNVKQINGKTDSQNEI